MKKTEFLSRLAEELKGISAEEREEALNYYSEYLDEAGEENEEAAIEELGGPEKVARIIRANTASQTAQPFQTSKAQPQSGAASQAAAPTSAPVQSGPEPAQGGRPAGGTHIPYEGYTQPRTSDHRWVWVLIGIVCIPIAICLLGAVFSLIGGVLAMLAAFVIGGATAAFAGIGLIVKSFFLFSSYPAGAVFMMGGGLLTGGLGVLACAFGIWLIVKGVPFLLHSGCSGWEFLKRKVCDWK